MELIFRSIDNPYTGIIYTKNDDKFVARFKNELEVAEFRYQAALFENDNYYFRLDYYPNIKINILLDGSVENHPDMSKYPNLTDILSKIRSIQIKTSK